MMRILLLLALLPALSGCIIGTVARTAVEVVSLPVRAISAGVDAATESQSEADAKRGRALRLEEERRGKAHRQWQEQCRRLTAKGQPCPPMPTAY